MINEPPVKSMDKKERDKAWHEVLTFDILDWLDLDGSWYYEAYNWFCW